MHELQTTAERWLGALVRDRVRACRLAALWQLVLCLFFTTVSYMVAFVGLFMAAVFLLRFMNPYIVAPGVVLAQFVIFPFVRRPTCRRWEITMDVDGVAVIAVPPDSRFANQCVYDQDHGFSFKRAYLSLFFAAPAALDEAIRDWREGTRLKRMNWLPAARLAEHLIEHQHKLGFEELRVLWDDPQLLQALRAASELPGFQLFSREPQGVALTDEGIQAMLTA